MNSDSQMRLSHYVGKKVFVSYSVDSQKKVGLFQTLMSVTESGILIDIEPGRHIFLSFESKYPLLTHMVTEEGVSLYGEWRKL